MKQGLVIPTLDRDPVKPEIGQIWIVNNMPIVSNEAVAELATMLKEHISTTK